MIEGFIDHLARKKQQLYFDATNEDDTYVDADLLLTSVDQWTTTGQT